jgi:carbon-monoxide dehydrogenase large subunit
MSRFGIGQPVRRVEDARFLTGRGKYVDDLSLPRQAHGYMVLSPHAHARIGRIDTARALAAPGVLGVFTAADVATAGMGPLPPQFMPEDLGGPKGHRIPRPLLAQDRVRHVGDRVAFVVAETPEEARDAAELVEIDYEPLPAVTSLAQAVAPGAPLVWDAAVGNLCVVVAMGDKPAVDAAFARAAHVVKAKLDNNRLAAVAMEPRGAIGDYDAAADAYTLHTSTQNPHGVRTVLAQAVLHIPETRLRVIAHDVGGGFGMKGDVYPEEALALLAARRCGRPVKVVLSRSDSFLGDDCGRDQVIEGEMAFDAEGRILGLRANALHNFGAYIVGAAFVPLLFAQKLLPNVYDLQAVYVTSGAIFTHTTPTAPYRGAGRPEAVYLTERLIERGAVALGIDAVELRRRNYIKPAAMPYTAASGFVYDSGEFETAMDKTIALADWNDYAQRAKASRSAGKLRGRALIYYIEDTGVFNDRMELRFDPSGACTIVAGTFSHGQAHATTFAQLVSEWLGIPFESIGYVQGDTNQVSFGRGTYASRSATVGGSALRVAADAVIDKGKRFAAFLLETSPDDIVFGEGRFQVAGTDRGVPLTEVAKAAHRPAHLPRELGVGLDASGSFSAEPPSFPNGCHICEVEIDPETGAVHIDRYTAIDDVGRVINPLIVHGQVHGGLAQGIGQALLEHARFDDAGQPVTASLVDYAVPRASDLPPFTVDCHEVPCRTNPVGVKGTGEAGTVGAPPAAINAILDALRPLGVTHIDMPATPERVWRAIAAARGENKTQGVS